MRKLILSAVAAGIMLTATALPAQDSSYKLGPLWTASRIAVEDGQYENYMDYLMKIWSDNQAFAKSQGWILDFHILDNVNPRDGEPNVILLTKFSDHPSVAEIERREKLIGARMKQDAHEADTASGQRTKMRKLMGTVLYRELNAR